MEREVLSLLIERYDDTYSLSVYKGEDGVRLEADEDFINENLEIMNQLFEKSKTIKSEREKELIKNEKEKKKLISIIDDKTSDEEKIKNKDIYPRLIDGLEVKENNYYLYIDKLYKALETFNYDNQQSPILEPKKWQALEKEEKSEYQRLFDEADFYSRDKSYKTGDYVKHMGALYKATEDIKEEAIPGEDERWELVKDEVK